MKRIFPILAAVLFIAASLNAQTTYPVPQARCLTNSALTVTCESFPVGLSNPVFVGFTRSTPAIGYTNHSVFYGEEWDPQFQMIDPTGIDSYTLDTSTTPATYEIVYHDPLYLTSVDLKFQNLYQSTHCGGKGSQSCYRYFWNIMPGSTYTILGTQSSPTQNSPIAPTPTCPDPPGNGPCPKGSN